MLLICIFLVAITAFAEGEKPPEVLRDPTLLQIIKKHHSGIRSPKTLWTFGDGQGSQQTVSQRFNYASYPLSTSGAARPTAGASSQSGYSYPTQEYWNPSSSSNLWYPNTTNTGSDISKAYSQYTTMAGDVYSTTERDVLKGSHSMVQYQQFRPSASSHAPTKKFPTYYIKSPIQLKTVENTMKPKFKKTHPILYYNGSGYKKNTYPRVHKPYAKHKYPAKKTVHTSFRRYYRSPYQQYLWSPNDILKLKVQKQNGYPMSAYKGSESSVTAYPTASSSRYHTTERMDDTYPATSEDYSNYNETYRKSQPTYYDEDLENATQDPEETSYEETSTRGYYGDRIYMNAQVPLKTSETSTVKNKYFVIRRTSSDDDLETIFE